METKNPPAPTIPNIPTSTDGIPVQLNLDVDVVALVKNIANCYQNISMEKERQETERMRILEQSRVIISKIEADTKRFEMVLAAASAERMTLINLVSDIIRCGRADEYSLRICETILNYLTISNPMNSIGGKSALITPGMLNQKGEF